MIMMDLKGGKGGNQKGPCNAQWEKRGMRV